MPRRWSICADTYLTVRAETPVEAPAPVAGGIPGFDRTGQEVIAGTFRVNDAPLSWDLHGRCGFATDLPKTYGYRRVHAALAGWGVPAGPELVRSLMRELGLDSRHSW